MTNRINFSVETEAPYSDEERDNLLEGLLALVKEEDADVVDGSEDLSIVDVNTLAEKANGITDEVRETVIKDFIEGARIEYQVQVRIKDDADKEVPGSVQRATGFLS